MARRARFLRSGVSNDIYDALRGAMANAWRCAEVRDGGRNSCILLRKAQSLFSTYSRAFMLPRTPGDR